jgi:type I restriction enzyme S subunit
MRYKDSGVEWLGKIPDHWEVKKLKYVSKIVLGKMICNTKIGSMELKPYLKSKNIQWLKVDLDSVDEMWFTQQEMVEYKLKVDDIILSEGGEVGKSCIWNNELPECYIQNSAHKVTVNNSCYPHYYLYLFNTIGYKGVFESIVNRVSIGHLTKEKLSNITILFPPKEEQIKIAQFLDKKTAQIDKAISQKEKLIELLKERKQIVINDAVTKGLDKNVEFKNSGVEWLGEIPEHWKLIKLKFLLKEKVSDGPHETPTFIDEGVPFLSVDGIQDGELTFEKCRYVSEKDHNLYSKKANVTKGSILMGKAASTGKIAQVKVNFPFSIWSPLALIKPNEQISSSILEYYLKSHYSQIQIDWFCNINTQKNIGMGDIPKILVVLPPQEEQIKIASFLDKKTAQIDKAIELQQNYISKLKEYKATLIDSVVTGKVKVI